MLLFSSDTFTVDGITVFPDHSDPNQFWYLPGPVGLETEADSNEPQFLMILYTPDVAAAGIKGTGFLNVTVALKVSDMTQAKIIGQIRSQFPNVSNPNLAPVSFDEGTVQIVALDLQGSGGTTAGAAPAGTGQAVEHILGASNPELFGNNDALFALTLSEEGATILEQAFQDGMTPVGAIYNLKFTGVLPALDVKITADLKRVYDSFSVGLTAQAYWVSAGIDATFEKLRQDQVIKVEIVNLATDGSTANMEQWALNLFKDQILTQFFTPSLTPATAAAADAQSVSTGTGTVGRPTGSTPTSPIVQPPHPPTSMGSPTPASGGSMGSPRPAGSPAMSSSTPGAGAASKPAGTSGTSLASPPAGGSASAGTPPSSSSSSATPATGGSSSIPATTATAPAPSSPAAPPSPPAAPAAPAASKPATNPLASAAGTAAAASSVASPFGVSLRLKYVQQDELKTVEYEFNQMNAVQRVYAPQGYFGLLLQGVDQSKHFLKVDGTDPFFNQFAVTINPPKDFSGIGLLEAHVALDYGDPTSTTNDKHGEFVFDLQHQTQQTWAVYEGLIQQTQYSYTADYKFDPESGWAGEQTSYTLPTVTTENRLLNLDPYDFLGFLQLSVSAGRINADLVDRIEVPLQYTAKSGWQTGTTIIVRPGSAPQSWKLRLADKDDRTYTYSTNCYLKDGTLISSAPVTSTASAVIISDPFVGGIDLTFQPAFDPSIYQLAVVELAYQDTAHNYSFQRTFQMQATSPATKIHIPTLDRTLNQYQYRITLINNANQQTQGNYITASDPLVLVSPGS